MLTANSETPSSEASACNVKPRRFKLEFYDDEGVRHSITIDGQVTREKVGRLLDLVEVMAGTPRGTASALSISPRKFDRLASTIISELKQREFTASEAKKAFETSFTEKIPVSTCNSVGVVIEGRVPNSGTGARTRRERAASSKSILGGPTDASLVTTGGFSFPAGISFTWRQISAASFVQLRDSLTSASVF